MPRSLKEEGKEKRFKRAKTWSFYSSDDPIEDFIDWLLQAFDGNVDVIIYAHYGSR